MLCDRSGVHGVAPADAVTPCFVVVNGILHVFGVLQHAERGAVSRR